MTKPFKPMKAVAIKEPDFPYFASAKLDGLRATVRMNVLRSNTLKTFPNKRIQTVLSHPALSGLDGELIVGNPNHEHVFRKTTSLVMSINKVENFAYYVFDDATDPNAPFQERFESARSRVFSLPEFLLKHVKILSHLRINNQQELDKFEADVVSLGYEGVMLRSPTGKYKYGRATVKENTLLKVKRFSDAEARVTGFEELMHNDNPKEVSELGTSKRASLQEHLRPAGTLGALIVVDVNDGTGTEFKVGTGFSAKMRKEIWDNQLHHLGKTFTYKHFPIGAHEKPRHSVFKGWRDLQLT